MRKIREIWDLLGCYRLPVTLNLIALVIDAIAITISIIAILR